MSDLTPEQGSQEESLFDRAMRQAKEAGAAVPSSSSGLEQAGLVGAGAAAGLAQTVKDATSPGTFTFQTVRPPAATLQVFVEALQALGDRDTRPQVGRSTPDQATVQFQQLLPTGNWVGAQTVTLIQSADTVTITVSAPSLAAMGGAAGEVGGTAVSTLGKVLSGNVLGGLTEAARSVGRLTESAENIALSSKIRSTLQRIGSALDDEWRQAERERLEREERQRVLDTCQFCGAPYPVADAVQCAVCGAPRSQGAAAG
jgi:hypothetical protein